MKGLEFLEDVWEETYADLDLPVYMVRPDTSDWDNFNTTFSHKFIPELFEALQLAIKEDLLAVPIFKVLFIESGKSFTKVCYRDEFDNALQVCLKHFENREEFEKCRIALNMIEHEG